MTYSLQYSNLDLRHGCGFATVISTIRDTTAKLLEEVCYDVQIEPRLIPISGENEEVYDAVRGNVAEHARLDVAARGVWSQYDRSFVDIRVTHPNSQIAYQTVTKL